MSEGIATRKLLKGSGMAMGDIADLLGLTRQGLNYHLRKEKLETNFRQLLFKKLPQVFSALSETNTATESSTQVINIPKNEGSSAMLDLANGQCILIFSLVQDYAYTSYISGYQDPDYLKSLPQYCLAINRQHPGNYVAFQVIGDSMNDGSPQSIVQDATVTAREIAPDLWNNRFNIHLFKDYVIIHPQGILINRIIKYDPVSAILRCRSLHPDKNAYPDFDITFTDCLQLFIIVAVTQTR